MRIDNSLIKANNRRIAFDYQPNQQILVKHADPQKLDERYHGPYSITQVHVNGNITYERNPNITERINIRRIKPYRAR